MTPVSRDPLTPEERELASRLSRIGPHGEPPAALDARILSAAHAALSTTPQRRRRWPAVLGVAATLALAVGISWQMRPHPDAAPALEEGPAAAPQETSPRAEAADAAAAMPPAPTSGAEAEAEATTETPQPQPQPQMAPPAATRSKVPAPEEPPVIIESVEAADEPPMELAPAPAPAAAPPAPPPPRPAPVPVAAPTSEAAASDRASAASAAKSVQRSAEPVVVTGSRLGNAPRMGDRVPRDVPIEEDARLPATDWLDRIRLRQAAGDVEGARASLALFRRYHPDRAIPQDLAPLAQ